MRESLYDAAGGAEGVLSLAHAWHERVLADPVVSHAFEHGYRADHTERLAAYWSEQLGGPATYTTTMGDQSQVLRLHSGNGEHHEMDERAVQCFVAALDDAGLADDAELRTTLVAWFRWGIGLMDAHPM
jgi:hemoglobin